ncbi:unnamed protein product [Darwinula stevensoni]|uniref:Uncharacterized protein n=1 Tax=Darwinula stevensoni TaxID=69355 RepID=A0A7R9A9U1_9CRUS|nr:unnamed protein product [Darwinula stevensoni]CAG0897741.1 unnamed protein product [Darwinula stevensoni]
MKALVLLGTVCAFLIPSSLGLNCLACIGVDCEKNPRELKQENCDPLIVVPGKEYYCGTGFSDDSREEIVKRQCVLYETEAEGCISPGPISGAKLTCLCSENYCNDYVVRAAPTTSTRDSDSSSTSAVRVAFVLLVSGILAAIVSV